MTVSNKALLEQAGEILEGMGVKALSPTVPTTDSLGAGEFMNRKAVDGLIDLTVSQNGWLAATSLVRRSQRAGEIPRLVINDVVTEGVGENAGATVATHPDTSVLEYQTKKFQATMYLTLEDIREARASGDANFDATVRRGFAKAMGNDMARAALRGDTSLPATTRENRLLRQRDGWLKKIRASGNRATTADGKAYARGVWSAMMSLMPDQYAEDPDLRWFFSRKIDIGWSDELAGYGASAGLASGGEQLTERQRKTPLGIPQLILPQMPTNLGRSVLSTTSTVNPNSVVDDSDGTLTAVVTALFTAGYATANAGRKVKITCTATGQSETLDVYNEGGAHKVATNGSLGQASISTTAGAYTIDFADITPLLLTNPKNLAIVLTDQMRAHRKFEQEYERWRTDVFYEADFLVYNPEAAVLQDGVVAPTATF